jgi:hypothetical protein
MLPEAGDLSVQFDSPAQFTTNLLDLLGLGDETSIVSQNSTQIFLVGPALELSATNSLLRGVLQTCHPHYYDQFAFSSSLTPSTEQIGNNSIRVQDSSGSSTVVDISFAADGSLAAGLGQLNPTADFTKTVIYTEFVTVVRDIFVGYVSWSRSDLYPISQLQDPQNVNCTKEALHQMAWQSSPISNITLTFMESAFSDADQVGGQIYGVTAAMTELQYIVSYILATVPDTADALAGDIPMPLAVGTVCGGPDMLPDGGLETLLAMGLITGFGTGMTVTGVVLQVLVAFFALLSLISLF